MSLDHIGIYVPASMHKEVVEWYLAALAPIGLKKFAEPNEYACGLGIHAGDFWIASHKAEKVDVPTHIGFKAENRKVIDEFHKAALAAGGKDNGAPGPRPQYHPNYYAAFVFDPAGNNVEVVCHKPEVAE
ncbi:glyoxalase bleomycin resistance protein dioxygenase [Colletotrichum truncatum]|uniref:Glyoxalase bleomycin resistance protein dioxygenase n=1 Tax=Colletotrichum truncatum TaxID=5467 RepID=A0ACC3Z2L1_COLTU|nr:glyoxalase bleomycin resistance protein dioxygenase [Colletotrichum truncatum]KAF6782683.1 glyoxalase bleomycin resistance protein dioxygenase [Colletotrichum truncatum]